MQQQRWQAAEQRSQGGNLEEELGAPAAGDKPDYFANDTTGDRSQENDKKSKIGGKAADQSQKTSHDKGQGVIVSLCSFKNLLLAAYALFAAVPGLGQDCTTHADRFVTAVAAQRGFYGRMIGTVQYS